MLNLMKYDWKKVSTLFYSLLGSVVVLQLAIVYISERWNWWDEVTVIVALLVTAFLLQVFYILFIYQFNLSLKSSTRVLLPISVAKRYFSQLIVSVSLYMIFLLECMIFIWLLKPTFIIQPINNILRNSSTLELVSSFFIFALYYVVFTQIFYFMCVAITRLFRTNARVAIFIGITIVLTVTYATIMGFLQPNENIINEANIKFVFDETRIIDIILYSVHWTNLIDLVLMVIMAYLTIYIMKNKLDI